MNKGLVWKTIFKCNNNHTTFIKYCNKKPFRKALTSLGSEASGTQTSYDVNVPYCQKIRIPDLFCHHVQTKDETTRNKFKRHMLVESKLVVQRIGVDP